MIRGTTPTLNFKLPFEADLITDLNIAFSQGTTVVLQKELDDVEVSEDVISVTLSEADTLALNANSLLEIQLRLAIEEVKMASKIITIPVGRILKDGAL